MAFSRRSYPLASTDYKEQLGVKGLAQGLDGGSTGGWVEVEFMVEAGLEPETSWSMSIQNMTFAANVSHPGLFLPTVTLSPVLKTLVASGSAVVGNQTPGDETEAEAPVRNPSSSPSPTWEGQAVLHGMSVAGQALLLLAIFLLSSLGNSAVVIVIVKHRQLRTVTNAFIMSLSLSDFLTAVLCLPFSFIMLFSKDGAWMFGERFCVANGFFNTCFGIISTLTMTLISFDRYYAIVRQPQEKIGRKKAVQLLAAVWFSAIIFSFPWYILVRPNLGEQMTTVTMTTTQVHKQGFYHCMYVFHSGTSRMGAAYSVGLIVVCYLLPFALMCFCHYNICKTVRLSEIRVRPVTTYAHLLRFYSEMRTATTVLIMIVFIIFCWGPYCLMGIITAVGRYPFNPAMDTVAIWMAWANGAINPLIYAIRNPNISMLLGRSREEGYRTRNIAAYLSAHAARHRHRSGRRGGNQVRTRSERIGERYVSRHGANSRLSSSSPANGGEVAMWACKNPAIFFCRDGQPDTFATEPAVPKVETANTSL